MNEEKIKLSFEEAISLLPDKDRIHTFRSHSIALLGAHWDRKDIVEVLKKYKPELSGPTATAKHHGIVVKDETGFLFIETNENRIMYKVKHD